MRQDPPSPTPPPDYSIAAVDRALDLLEALARGGPANLAQLATRAGCTRTAAFRIMRTLQARGFALQDGPRGVWRLGVRTGALGSAAVAQRALARAAAPAMRGLAEVVGENIYLLTRDGLESEIIAVVQGADDVPIAGHLGRRRPLHAGPSRMLLAFAPPALVTQTLTMRLPRFTPATRTDAQWIAADLRRIRERGWLITSDEMQLGVVSITAPARDVTGEVVAALSVASTANRLRPPRPRALVPFVIEAAGALSRLLGFDPPTLLRVPHDTGKNINFQMIESISLGNGLAFRHGGTE